MWQGMLLGSLFFAAQVPARGLVFHPNVGPAPHLGQVPSTRTHVLSGSLQSRRMIPGPSCVVTWTPFSLPLGKPVSVTKMRGGLCASVSAASASLYSDRDFSWAAMLLKTPHSRVLRRIRWPIAASAMWASMIWALYALLPLPLLSFKPHSLVGSALSLLLVFRTNSSYTRFFEARKSWQKISDKCRSLARFTMLFREKVGTRRHDRVERLLCAFPYVLKQHLRGGEALTDETSCLLSDDERETIEAAHHAPLALVNLLAQQLASVPDTACAHDTPFTSRERLSMLKEVSSLSDCIGACERIVQTPVPLHYARHTCRLATLFVFTLPLVLARELGIFVVPTVAVTAWVFFGIQEIGYLIEEPFREIADRHETPSEILQLDAICSTIQRDVCETLACGSLSAGSATAAQQTCPSNEGRTPDALSAVRRRRKQERLSDLSP